METKLYYGEPVFEQINEKLKVYRAKKTTRLDKSLAQIIRDKIRTKTLTDPGDDISGIFFEQK